MSDSDPFSAVSRRSPGQFDALPRGSAHITDLLLRVADQDRKAFAELYHATAPKLMGTILRILNHRGWAEEVLQEAFVRVWQKAGLFDPKRASPITWLLTIARNLAIDRIRSQPPLAAGGIDELGQLASAEPDGQSQLESRQAVEQLNQCLEQLERDRRDMVRLAYLNGWSRDQLAAHFGQPVNTVKTWLRRALTQLKGCLTS